MKRFWCKLLHRKSWRVLWWVEHKEGVREFWEACLCLRCGSVHDMEISGTDKPDTSLSMSKISDPTVWS